MSEGKLEEMVRQKRAFLQQAKKDYASGGNDMLDDVEAALREAKTEILHNLELAGCLREEEGEEAWHNECQSMFNSWLTKWFGKP